jgi:hypothetical protein
MLITVLSALFSLAVAVLKGCAVLVMLVIRRSTGRAAQ